MTAPTRQPEPPFAPVFIVGFPRSGTTLLATLLGRHSRFAATPETHFCDRVAPRGWRWSRSRPRTHAAWIDRALADLRFKDLELDRAELLLRFEEFPAAPQFLFRAALEAYSARHAKPRIVEKTPAHRDHVDRLLRWYPEARVLYIVRDGRDACLSMMRARWTHNNLRRHAAHWRYCAATGARDMRRFGDRMLQVRFEGLVQEPEAVMGDICRYLGEIYEPNMLDVSASGGVAPEWEREWKEKAGGVIDPSRIGVWHEAPVEQRWLMNSMMGPWLRRLGYDQTELIGCPPRVRMRNAALNLTWRAAHVPQLSALLVAGKRGLARLGLPIGNFDAPEVDVEIAAQGANTGRDNRA